MELFSGLFTAARALYKTLILQCETHNNAVGAAEYKALLAALDEQEEAVNAAVKPLIKVNPKTETKNEDKE